MTRLLTTLGLQALTPSSPQPPCYAATAIISNFMLSYVILSTRYIKRRLKFDHNVNPRTDVARYGEQMVRDGKITRRQLDRVNRWESAHANSVEHFPFFFGSVLFALQTGVPHATINGLCVLYTIARVLFGIAYINIETEKKSFFRTLCWWTGNITCMTLVGKAGLRLNSAK